MCNLTNRLDRSFVDPHQMKRAPRSSLDQLLRSEQTTSTRIHAQAHSRARLTTRPLGNATRLEQVRSAAIAFILAGVAPASLMTLYWHDSRIAPMVFAFTLMIALGHTIFLALPLILIFRSLGWVNFVSCVVLGAVIGAAPESIPICRIVFCAWAWATGQPVISAVTAATWDSCIKPVIYFGLFGAFGGLVFWAVLACSGWFDRVRPLRSEQCTEQGVCDE
jgi:hypothetical protein